MNEQPLLAVYEGFQDACRKLKGNEDNPAWKKITRDLRSDLQDVIDLGVILPWQVDDLRKQFSNILSPKSQ